jgi:hypothetical protein
MIPEHVFRGSVIIAAALFAAVFAASGEVVLAIAPLALGAVWLAVDAKAPGHLGTMFFVAFLVLAAIADLDNAPLPLPLVGLSADLAAWDLSRFRARLASETAPGVRAVVENRHLRILAATLSVGFLIALLPEFIHLTIPFVLVCIVTLLALLMLHQSMRSLRAAPQSDQKRTR